MSNKHRYSLVLPNELFKSLDETAEKRGHTTAGLLRNFIRLGLTLMKYEEDGAELIIRQPDGEDIRLLLGLEH